MEEIKKALEGKSLIVDLYSTKYEVYFLVERYRTNGRAAIDLFTKPENEPFATLSVNIPDVILKEREVLIKTWSENEKVADAARKSGLFRDTGKRVSTGFVEAQIWEVI